MACFYTMRCFGGQRQWFQQYLHRKAACNPPADGGGRVSDMALLAHIRAIHAETQDAYGWPRM